MVGMRENKIYAVGDDWQSIYSFSGSRIEFTYNFKNILKIQYYSELIEHIEIVKSY